MTIPDSLIMGAIGSLAVFAAWLTKRIANSYFADIKSTKDLLSNIHDEIQSQTEIHSKQCQALDNIVCMLKKINGHKGGK